MKEVIGLIAGRSGDTLTNELKKRGYEVALVIGKEDEPGSKEADFVFINDLRNHKEIYNFFKEKNVNYLVVGTGHYLALELFKYLEKKGIKLSINLTTTLLCKNKYKLKEKIEKMGYKTPKYLLIDKSKDFFEIANIVEKNFNYPIVLKSPDDKVLPVAVQNIEEIRYYCKLLKEKSSDIMLEEYIVGSDVTTPVLNDGKITKALGIMYWSKGKEENLKGFEKAYSNKIPDEEDVLKQISNLIKELNVLGLSRVDYIYKDKQIYILEINSIIVTGNTGSTYNETWKKNGYKFPALLIENALNIFNLK